MLPLNRSRNRSRFFGLAVPQSSLDLDFLSGTLDPRITFTRASSGTFFGSNGLLQTAANDVPRFDYDPVTRAARGLLIEEQRTNLLTWSEDFGNAVWTTNRVTVSADAATAPSGTLSADNLVATAVLGDHGMSASIATVAPGTSVTSSVFVRKAEYRYAYLWLDNASGIGQTLELDFDTGITRFTRTDTTNYSGVTSTVSNIGGGWFRISISATTTYSIAQLRVYMSPTAWVSGNFGTPQFTGDGTSGILLWGAQLEAGAFPTSYIPTTSATATREADTAVMTGTNFSSWFNATEGTILSEALITGYTVPAANFPLIASLNDGTANNFVEVGYLTSSLSSLVVRTENVEQVGMYPSVGAVQTRKIAGVYRINDFAVSANGGVTQTDVSGTVPTVDRLRFGERTATSGTSINCLNGHIRRIVYWPVRISNTQLRRITA